MSRALAVAAVVVALLTSLAGCGSGGPDLPPLPTDRPSFGFNEIVMPDGAGNELIAESGASFVRTPLSWASVEPREGFRDFATPDRIRDELANQGLRPLWVVTSAPCWAGAVPCDQQRNSLAPSPEHLDDYAEFTAEVAKRYPEAVGIEVWNEPNIPNFWRPHPDADVYRELLAKTADAVHASGSEVPVVMAGPSPTTQLMAADQPQKIPFVEFIEQVMSGPGAPNVDAIGTHPYSLLQRDADPIRETIRLFEQAAAAAERAAPAVPVWVTEVGLTTAGRNAVDPQTQADGLVRILDAIEAAGVPVITVHRFFDQADPPLAFERGFGVVAADRATRKPAFCAIAGALGAQCE